MVAYASLISYFLPPQTERNDLLETVRQLTRTLKLKELIIANFIPEESARLLERRAAWVENEEGDGWVMPVSVRCVVAAWVEELLSRVVLRTCKPFDRTAVAGESDPSVTTAVTFSYLTVTLIGAENGADGQRAARRHAPPQLREQPPPARDRLRQAAVSVGLRFCLCCSTVFSVMRGYGHCGATYRRPRGLMLFASIS
jgi:hypothetical protein